MSEPARRRTVLGDYLRTMEPHIDQMKGTMQVIIQNIDQITTASTVTQDYRHLAAEFDLFGNSFEALILHLAMLAGENEKLKLIINQNVTPKIANAVMLAEHLSILEGFDPIRLAGIISQMRDKTTVEATVAHIDQYGSAEDRQRLTWLKEALEGIDKLPVIIEQEKSMNQQRAEADDA